MSVGNGNGEAQNLRHCLGNDLQILDGLGGGDGF